MSYDEKMVEAGVKVAILGAFIGLSGIYHHFATNSKDIKNIQINDKMEKVWYSCSGSGKKRSCHWEHDYYLYTNVGTIRDESSIWDGKFGDGKFFNKIEKGSVCDFTVNHDNIFGGDNLLDCKTVTTATNSPTY